MRAPVARNRLDVAAGIGEELRDVLRALLRIAGPVEYRKFQGICDGFDGCDLSCVEIVEEYIGQHPDQFEWKSGKP